MTEMRAIGDPKFQLSEADCKKSRGWRPSEVRQGGFAVFVPARKGHCIPHLYPRSPFLGQFEQSWANTSRARPSQKHFSCLV